MCTGVHYEQLSTFRQRTSPMISSHLSSIFSKFLSVALALGSGLPALFAALIFPATVQGLPYIASLVT